MQRRYFLPAETAISGAEKAALFSWPKSKKTFDAMLMSFIPAILVLVLVIAAFCTKLGPLSDHHGGFSAAFTTAPVSFTEARRVEVFGATAAFVAVQVANVGNADIRPKS